ncbi:hypothetical protein QTP70_027735, partial [Hemibagrus guttatus]
PQAVRMGRHVSASLTVSTGAPQGCVLSPLLYSLYMYDCVATTIIKFADDTIVVGLISDNNDTAYLEEIRNLENWCQRNNLLLNWREWTASDTSVFTFPINTVVKKAWQHLYHLRRLRDFRLPSKMLSNFYPCTIESILTGNIATWFRNSTMQDRRALQRVVRSAECIIHTKLPDLHSIYNKWCLTKARKMNDLSHPNNGLFSLLRSGKRQHRETEEKLLPASYTDSQPKLHIGLN